MNFVLVNSEYPSNSGYGEIANYVHNMALALYEEGHEVHVIHRLGVITEKLPSDIRVHYFDRLEPKGITQKITKHISGLAYWEKGFSYGLLEKIKEIHNTSPIDMVEIPEYGGLAHAFKGELPFKFMIGFHMCLKMTHRFSNIQATIDEHKFYNFETTSVRNGHFYRFPSRAMLNETRKYFNLPEVKCRVIANPIDVSNFQRIEKDKKKDGIFHILYSGKLETIKGAAILAASINEILAINDNIHITFAGDPSPANQGHREVLERLLSPSERNRVWFTGPLDHYRLSLMYRKSDMLICPQLFGNIPYCVIEAMASELPTVCSNSGGIPEFIHNEKTGLLFSIKNSNDFVDKVRLLYLSSTMQNKIAQNALEQVKETLNSAVIVKKYIEFFQQNESV